MHDNLLRRTGTAFCSVTLHGTEEGFTARACQLKRKESARRAPRRVMCHVRQTQLRRCQARKLPPSAASALCAMQHITSGGSAGIAADDMLDAACVRQLTQTSASTLLRG